MERKNISGLMIAGLVLGLGWQLDAAVPINVRAMQLLKSKDAELWKRGNLLLSFGGSEVSKEKNRQWQLALNEVKTYVKNVDSSLLKPCETLIGISNMLFTSRSKVYNDYIVHMIMRQEDKKSGILDTNFRDIVEKMNFNPDTCANCMSNLQQAMNKMNWRDVRDGEVKSIIEGLEAKLEQYRSSIFTSKKKGDAVEVVLELARLISAHITRFMNHQTVLQSMASKWERETSAQLDQGRAQYERSEVERKAKEQKRLAEERRRLEEKYKVEQPAKGESSIGLTMPGQPAVGGSRAREQAGQQDLERADRSRARNISGDESL